MFGRKANQIKALKQTLEIKDRILADRVMVLAGANEKIVKLDAEIQRVAGIAEEKIQQVKSLSVERDQLAKRVEELEEKARLKHESSEALEP